MQYWENPEIFEENKEAPHCLAFAHDNFKQAVNGEQPPYKLSLNGEWKFHWQMGTDGLPSGFSEENFDDASWNNITVPSVWQLKGYGKPVYLCAGYPKAISTAKRKIPTVSHSKNEVGIYRRTFVLPENYAGKQIFIHFGAVKSAFFLYINGKRIGYSQGSMTPAEFNITDFVRQGENQVTAEVYRYSDGTYLEDQDMWFLSGIYREVYLFAEKNYCLWDIFAKTSLDDEYKNGLAEIEVALRNYTDTPVTAFVDVLLFRTGEQPRMIESNELLVKPGESFFKLNHIEPDALQWSAEQPNLYSLAVVLRNSKSIISAKIIKIGFRRIEKKGNVLYINGKKGLIKGVNRHDFDPDNGWAVPKDKYYADLYLMKRANINAIRTSHYPNDPMLYDLCDELGFYVMDEADIETHGVRRKNTPGDDPRWTCAVVDRVQRMVMRDRSHACVCFWSLGNEAGDGSNFLAERKAILELDDSRLIHYEGEFNFDKSDFISRMYPTEKYVEKLGNKQEIKVNFFENLLNRLAADSKPISAEAYETRPVIFCEYAHAMENSLGNFKEYMDAFEKYDNLCGGFIWDYVDQSIRVHENGVEKWLYGGDFDEGMSSYYFCANGIISADRRPHPSYFEVKKVYAPMEAKAVDLQNGVVEIFNKNLFASLDDYAITWNITDNGKEIFRGNCDGLHVPAQSSVKVKIPYDISQLPGGECVLTIGFLTKNNSPWAAAGYEQSFDQFVLKEETQPEESPFGDSEISCIWHGKEASVSSGLMSAEIIAGKLVSLRYGGTEMIVQEDALRPNFFRAPVDNDCAYLNFVPYLKFLHPKYQWRRTSKQTIARKMKVQEISDTEIKVTVKWFAPFVFGAKTEYSFCSNGEVTVRHTAGSLFKQMLRVGMRMGINSAITQAEWYGRGPHECYCDRKTGGKIAVHKADIDQLEHKYMRPQENGNRTETRCLILKDICNSGIKISGIDGSIFDFSAHNYSLEKLDKAEHQYELERDNYVSLYLDAMQCGVGGDIPGWAHLREPYIMHPWKKYSMNIKITPMI